VSAAPGGPCFFARASQSPAKDVPGGAGRSAHCWGAEGLPRDADVCTSETDFGEEPGAWGWHCCRRVGLRSEGPVFQLQRHFVANSGKVRLDFAGSG
jgi:hypothetical protein